MLLIFLCKIINASPLFDTEYYEVKFISDDINSIKNNKISNIKYKIINEIFKNVLTKDNYIKTNQILNEDLINYFIKNILVEEENIINNNYYSKIKINYDKNKIIDYLRTNQIPYVEYLPNEFLILIYENNQVNKNLFSKNNSHYKYLLNNYPLFNFFITPNLDVNDRFLLNYQDIENRNYKRINKLVKKYSDLNVVILKSEKINKKIKYSLYYYDDNKFLEIKEFYHENINYNKLFKNLKLEIIDFWKLNNQIQNNKIEIINCQINYFNLLELKQIKINLRNTSVIKKIDLKNISYKKNNYDIFYYGNNQILPILFKMNGLNMSFIDNQCKISLK